MLDSDLAQLYQVETKALNQAVKRNADRFPEDFMFQLTDEEAKNLRYQIGICSTPSPSTVWPCSLQHCVARVPCR